MIDSGATLICPHGGSVNIVASNANVTAGAPVAVQTDAMIISGCTFAPGGAASPCVQVQWVVADTRVTVGGVPTLSQGSTGLCLATTGAPQGTVIVASTQTRAQSV
ncbi:MAG: hypothetical protein GY937_25545 [bacterium]|nr:hypothetical protein [bacterium]